MFAILWALEQDPTHLGVVTELVRGGADVHHVVPNFARALDLALAAKDPGLLRAMLDGGMSPDVRLGGDTPAVFRAANETTQNSLELLIERGANVNARDSLGMTALLRAVYGMQLDQAEYLLDHGANPHPVDRLGRSLGNTLAR